MTDDIKLPPEFISTNDIPVSVATIKRGRMEEILREAIEADRQRRGEPEIQALRDCFAAKTMQAIYARLGGTPSAGSDHDGTLTHIAEGAYQMADAMLAQREKQK